MTAFAVFVSLFLLLVGVSAQSNLNSSSTNISIAFTAPANTLLGYREYPTCGYDIHHSNTANTTMIVVGGFSSGASAIGTNVYSTDGFSTATNTVTTTLTTSIANANANFTARYSGGAVITYSGVLIFFAGKLSSGADNTVYYSTDFGHTYYFASTANNGQAAWPARTAPQYTAIPYTNSLVMCGGHSTGAAFSDCYLSNDGYGAVWITQCNPCTFNGTITAPLVAFFDSALVSPTYTSPNSTLLLFANYAAYYRSTNLGITWTQMPTPPWTTRAAAAAVVDHDNIVYIFGGTDNDAYFSIDKGNSFQPLYQIQSGLGAGHSYVQGTTGSGSVCIGLRTITQTNPSTSASTSYKQIVLYSGDGILINGSTVYLLQAQVSAKPLPQLTFAFPSTTIITTNRKYATCTYDNHRAPTALNASMYYLGGYSPAYADLYVSFDGFNSTLNSYDITPSTLTGTATAFPARYAGGAAVLANGNLLYFAGKVPTSVSANGYGSEVLLSTDYGHTWVISLGSAPFANRSDPSVTSPPGTNTVLMCGGQLSSGADAADCWVSTDGQGAVWTPQSTNPNIPVWQSNPLVSLYDSVSWNSALYTQQYSTIVLLTNHATVYITLDLGVTFAGPFAAPWPAQSYTNAIADVDNIIVVMAGAGGSGSIYGSFDKGNTFFLLQENSAISGGSYVSADWTCLAWHYQTNGAQITTGAYVSPSQVFKQYVLYGGSINLTSVATTTVVHINTNAPVSQPHFPLFSNIYMPYVPPFYANNVTMTLPPNPTLITMGQYSDCAFDVHSRGPNVSMFVLGGEAAATGNGFYVSTDGYGSTVNLMNPAPTRLTNSPTNFTGRYASGSALLANGNLLYFGGKKVGGTYDNVVYYTSDHGKTMSLATLTAQWSARSDPAVVCFPYTNTVLLAGGQTLNGAAAVDSNDVWINTDGTGLVWTQQCAACGFNATQSQPAVAFYDNQFVPNSGVSNQPNSTVIVFTQTVFYYTSTNAGLTWVPAIAPWSPRAYMFAAVDHDNILYIGGGNSMTSDLYVSFNKGGTFSTLGVINNYISPNAYTYASISCLAVRETPSFLNPSTYVKQLVMYGGTINVGSNIEVLWGNLLYTPSSYSTSTIISAFSCNSVAPTATGSWRLSFVVNMDASGLSNTFASSLLSALQSATGLPSSALSCAGVYGGSGQASTSTALASSITPPAVGQSVVVVNVDASQTTQTPLTNAAAALSTSSLTTALNAYGLPSVVSTTPVTLVISSCSATPTVTLPTSAYPCSTPVSSSSAISSSSRPSTATTGITASTKSSSSASNPTSGGGGGSGLSSGAIAGIVIGSVVGGLCLLCLIVWLCFACAGRTTKKETTTTTTHDPDIEASNNAGHQQLEEDAEHQTEQEIEMGEQSSA